jgi:thiol-disulfide isomerase/thioredoxin
MPRHYRLAAASLLVVPLLLLAQGNDLVRAVSKAAWAKDVATAERLVAEHRRQHPEMTPQLLEAISWVGRGASFAQQWDIAERYAREAYDGSKALLAKRALDADRSLPLALGAAIEVLGAVYNARGDRAGAVEFLRTEHATYKGTSIETRLQKNIHLLSLEGKPVPEIAMPQWVGAKPKPVAELKGRVVLAYFWAHWCGDCKRQMPVLKQLQDKYGSQGLTIVGPTQLYGYISRGQDATPEQEMAYLRGEYQKQHPIPSWMSVPVSGENFLRYGVSTTPTLMLVDRQGIVRLYNPGNLPYETLAEKIEKLLAGRT